MALGRALIYEGNEPVLGTNPNRTHDQPKPYLETAETVLDLYLDKGMFPFLLRGAHKKNSLKIDAFPFSNRTRNHTRTAAECKSWKTSKTISTLAILWPVKAIFEKRAAAVEIDTIDAESITNLVPQTFFGVTEVITQTQ